MAYETEQWPYVKARWFGPKRAGPPRLIVIHDMEFPERMDAAEVIARDFQTRTEEAAASAHICCDADSIIQCVKDSYVAWAAPGANHDGIQIELAGFGAQKTQDWRDLYSTAMLALAADAVAQYSLKYGIPIMKLSDANLRNGNHGVVGHDQVSRVYHKSTHTDPGEAFPWTRFLTYAKASWLERSA